MTDRPKKITVKSIKHPNTDDVISKNSHEKPTCTICFENPGFSLVTTKCGHHFCFECYERHVNSGQNYSHKCPTCRAPLNEIGENLVRREEYLNNLPAPDVDDEESSSTTINDPAIWAQIGDIFSEMPDAEIPWTRFTSMSLEEALPPVNTRPVNNRSNSSRSRVRTTQRQGTTSNPAEPKYNLYPGYNGPWTVKGHPDKRSANYSVWSSGFVLPNSTNRWLLSP